MPRNRTFVPVVDGLEPRKLLSDVPLTMGSVSPQVQNSATSDPATTPAVADDIDQYTPILGPEDSDMGSADPMDLASMEEQWMMEAIAAALQAQEAMDQGSAAPGGPTRISPSDPYN